MLVVAEEEQEVEVVVVVVFLLLPSGMPPLSRCFFSLLQGGAGLPLFFLPPPLHAAAYKASRSTPRRGVEQQKSAPGSQKERRRAESLEKWRALPFFLRVPLREQKVKPSTFCSRARAFSPPFGPCTPSFPCSRGTHKVPREPARRKGGSKVRKRAGAAGQRGSFSLKSEQRKKKTKKKTDAAASRCI